MFLHELKVLSKKAICGSGLAALLPELFVVAFGNSVYSWGTVFHWCLHQDSTVSGLSDCGIPFVCLILFSWPALAICAGGGRKGQSIKPGKKINKIILKKIYKKKNL